MPKLIAIQPHEWGDDPAFAVQVDALLPEADSYGWTPRQPRLQGQRRWLAKG